VAVHDSRRGSKHQKFGECKVENTSGLPMPQPTFAHWDPDTKLHAGYGIHCSFSLHNLQSFSELWALLHFIMPSLFDSHDEFNEWFSKDIENAAENKGSKLNEHQLRRLHMILKPFMLRRVKKHVQNELSEKVRKFLDCKFTVK
jgi:hypothetical protein